MSSSCAADPAIARARHWLDATRVHPDRAPGWMHPLLRGLDTAGPADISANDLAPDGIAARQSAVLVLLSGGPDGPEVVLQRRARRLRHHSGEISFPGGRRDEGDHDPVATALREAQEETGLDPSTVDVVATFPRLVLLTGFHVTAVLGHWTARSTLSAADPAETEAVLQVPLATLAEPAHRFRMRAGGGAWRGPAFRIGDDVVWGYTGEVLDTVLRMGGWHRDWPPGPEQDWEDL
ncbi:MULTISPECIES: NUDIX hydrolase [Pseudonocardia]|uniref:Coenzyme A pyrophosphatase n=2 Tax=Pseudonocardia TaxID=1847 RepID=A0ABQ0RRA9_9PSEU|nr:MULTISPECIES: CoA pyrophosphatase [Pseudonocardia]OSY39051.1 putative NUDIX hydrolase [Pseudonocardia autotrophica]TDN71353.1 ADP-ribose pyrophosphatase YjhB (NUDIX family) [Pseudonocardia autotrophica]BBG02028.1 coenzyme A pyrophosphatase [Pseudonocardia autotrophica]GEC23191.1 coenzyme A pyrophosphatase [Pseudonocardia saturnea]